MKIIVDGKDFEKLGMLDYIIVADSFVSDNKTGVGHGETRLYVGPQNSQVSEFFDILPAKGFFLRSELESYLNDAEMEYKNPRKKYNRDISSDWLRYLTELGRLPAGRISFSFDSANGRQDVNRFYIRSHDYIYEFIRKIAIPQISYITIQKLRADDGKILYYFRLFLQHVYTTFTHKSVIEREEKEEEKIWEDTRILETEKEQLVKSRRGQGIFRTRVLEEFPVCPMTGVDDERILIASHIKPWSVSDNSERLDPKNGLMLTPTFDSLFDGGLISFEDDGTLLTSSCLSLDTLKKLGLVKKKYPIPVKGREKYLRYHREKVFRE